MPRTIYKYPFRVADRVTLDLPAGARPLMVDDQMGAACLWAEVDPEAAAEPMHFRVFGTGHPIPDDPGLRHVGSWQSGPFVWHLYAWHLREDRRA